MKIAKIHYASRFIKDFKKLSLLNQKSAVKKEKLFRENPFLPSLKTHKLSGRLADFWAFSISYQERILFRFISQNEVIFYKVGSHAIYD